MSKDQDSRASKLAEQAADRERMARIVRRHAKPAPRKTTPRPEDTSPPAVRMIKEAAET